MAKKYYEMWYLATDFILAADLSGEWHEYRKDQLVEGHFYRSDSEEESD